MNPKILALFFLISFYVKSQHSQFTWLSGNPTLAVSPIYGTQGVASATNNPGARYNCSSWKDNAGFLYLFGGTDNSGASYNDLWRYNTNTGEYTWLKGSNSTNQYGSYGTQGVSSYTNTPGARQGAMTWVDNSGNFWLFGGKGYSIPMGFNLGPGYLNDLWRYDVSTNEWTWVLGTSSTYNINGVHGTQGVSTASNFPGSRDFGATWSDNSGNLWLFGGLGYDGSSSASYSVLNDLWKYTISTNQWTWMGGDVLANYNGVYGTKGLASSSNKPGARRNTAFWKDAAGDFWMFGGYGFPKSFGGTIDPLNDLWKYSVSTNEWTWVSGSDLSYQVGNYGCIGIRASTNVPGSRSEMLAWNDGNDVIWIQGGTGRGTSSNGSLNDLWRYETNTNTWTWMKGSSSPGVAAITGTMGIPSPLNVPGSGIATNWVDNNGKFWAFGRPNNVMWSFTPPCSSSTLTPAVI
ncbi:MAG: hypothetical protein JNL60_17335, partial [Bacteroidia bacterium]|nr:hypothetical protein [Bacteroidia bacterium]